jgi:hypothetical protein
VERLLETVGLPAAAAARTTIAGGDPVLPSRFPIGEAAAAALAAAAAAAAHVHELRTGTAQDVHVDVADAAAALCSHALQRLDGAELHPATDALAGLFQTRDGRHIQLFGSFPHLANGTLAVLGARALACGPRCARPGCGSRRSAPTATRPPRAACPTSPTACSRPTRSSAASPTSPRSRGSARRRLAGAARSWRPARIRPRGRRSPTHDHQ